MEPGLRQDHVNSNQHLYALHSRQQPQGNPSPSPAPQSIAQTRDLHQPDGPNPQTHDDGFNTYINDDGNAGFNSSWEPQGIIDPRLHGSPFAQPQHEWSQNAMHQGGSVYSAGQNLQPNEYSNAFSQGANVLNYPGFDEPQFHGYTGASYSQNVPFSPTSMLDQSAFTQDTAQSFGTPAPQGQTVAPSALQSYPAFSQSQTSQPQAQAEKPPAPLVHRGAQGAQKQNHPLYNEDFTRSLATKIPAGVSKGELVVKPFDDLSTSTDSERFLGHLTIGNSRVETDDQRAILPRTTPRRSLKDLKRKIVQDQGDRPWDSSQRPILKRLKLRVSTPKPVKPSSAGAVASPINQAATSSESEAASSSEYESDEGSSSDAGEGPVERSPLPASRPNDPQKAVEYDTIKIAWFKRSSPVSAADIRNALGEYWNLVKPIREDWRTELTAVQTGEGEKNATKVEKHKSRANIKRGLLNAAFKAMSEHGHPDIAGRLSENPSLLIALYQIIVDRTKEGDSNGETIEIILKLLLRFAPIREGILEKTKLDKGLDRLVKRGNDSIKALAQRVIDRIMPTSTGKSGQKENQSVDSSKNSSQTHPNSNAVLGQAAKRLKEEDAKSVKKPNSAPPKLNSISAQLKASAGSAKSSPGIKAPPGKLNVKPAVSANSEPSDRPKVKQVESKPTSLFSSLQSASKKPGTSNAAKKAIPPVESKASSKPVERTEPEKEMLPLKSMSSFSFAETMEDLNRPKEDVKDKRTIENHPPETEEEKKRRLRKEARRHLRVTWKPDASLVDIRTFKHFPEEEIEHDPDRIRDDLKNEGRMLKLHKEKELDEDDEDENDTRGSGFIDWHMPSAVNFSEVLSSEDTAQNYIGRGGTNQPTSPETIAQRQRELTSLIAIYDNPDQIPPNPREPPDQDNASHVEQLSFGEPQDKIRSRERDFYSQQQRQNFNQGQQTPQYQQSADISRLLSTLKTGSQGATQQPSYSGPQPSQPQAVALEAIFAQFAGTPKPVAPPPSQNFDDVINLFNQQQQALSQQNVYSAPPVPPPAPPAPPPPSATADLSSLLARLAQPSGNPSQGYTQPIPYQQDNDRKRHYDDTSNGGSDAQTESKRAKGNSDKPKYTGVPIVPCKFWQEGKCRKGDKCTFLHS